MFVVDDSLDAFLRPKIIQVFGKAETPLFLGEIACEVGQGFERVQHAVESLVDDGILRLAEPSEIEQRFGLPVALMYALVKRDT